MADADPTIVLKEAPLDLRVARIPDLAAPAIDRHPASGVRVEWPG
jgi:hypothetical protein